MRESKNFKDFLGPSFLRQLISFLSHFFDTKKHAQKKRERKRERKKKAVVLCACALDIYIYTIKRAFVGRDTIAVVFVWCCFGRRRRRRRRRR